MLNARFCELKATYERLIQVERVNDDDEDEQNKDFNKMVEELGEEINKVEQLRKQLIEKDERRMKQRKRLHSEMEKKQNDMILG